MMVLVGWFCVMYLLASVIEARMSAPFRGISMWLLLTVWISILLVEGEHMAPWMRLLCSCVGTLWLLKLLVRRAKRTSRRSSPRIKVLDELLFRFIWPGMSDEPFRQRKAPTTLDGVLFVKGYVSLLVGLVLMIALALVSGEVSDSTLGCAGLLPLFLVVHFGYAAVLTALLRLSHRPVPNLFDEPLASVSLQEFWGRRWNLPFVEMNRAILFDGLAARFGRRVGVFVTFLLSGIVHELGISYPAGGGFGLPTAYFVLHGSLVLIEGRRGSWISQLSPMMGRIWVLSALLVPLPLLFHADFRSALILPLYRTLGGFLLSYHVEDYLSLVVLLAGLGHFLVLVAGIQVPFRLGWREDLAKLKPFNRKIMWNYGFFILVLIIAFGIETLLFRPAIVAGDPAALGIAALIGGFWLLRLLVDYFYFCHSDWPEGPTLVVGHALLNSLFAFLVLAYTSVLVWHW